MIETAVVRIGNRSASFRYRIHRGDGTLSATFLHTVVAMDMGAVKSCDMPTDVRSLLEAHLAS